MSEVIVSAEPHSTVDRGKVASSLLLGFGRGEGSYKKSIWVRQWCESTLGLTQDDMTYAVLNAAANPRLEYGVHGIETTAGAFPATEEEQRVLDFVDIVEARFSVLGKVTQPVVQQILTAASVER